MNVDSLLDASIDDLGLVGYLDDDVDPFATGSEGGNSSDDDDDGFHQGFRSGSAAKELIEREGMWHRGNCEMDAGFGNDGVNPFEFADPVVVADPLGYFRSKSFSHETVDLVGHFAAFASPPPSPQKAMGEREEEEGEDDFFPDAENSQPNILVERRPFKSLEFTPSRSKLTDGSFRLLKRKFAKQPTGLSNALQESSKCSPTAVAKPQTWVVSSCSVLSFTDVSVGSLKRKSVEFSNSFHHPVDLLFSVSSSVYRLVEKSAKLGPGESVCVSVDYCPLECGTDSCRLVVMCTCTFSNQRQELDVSLFGVGGTCNLQCDESVCLSETPENPGLVSGTIKLVNTGERACRVRAEQHDQPIFCHPESQVVLANGEPHTIKVHCATNIFDDDDDVFKSIKLLWTEELREDLLPEGFFEREKQVRLTTYPKEEEEEEEECFTVTPRSLILNPVSGNLYLGSFVVHNASEKQQSFQCKDLSEENGFHLDPVAGLVPAGSARPITITYRGKVPTRGIISNLLVQLEKSSLSMLVQASVRVGEEGLVVAPDDELFLGKVDLYQATRATVKIQNHQNVQMQVKFYVQAQPGCSQRTFRIKPRHNKISLEPRMYTVLPIKFQPTQFGQCLGTLNIVAMNGVVLKQITLKGFGI